MKKTWLFLTALLFSSVAFSAIDALNFSSPQQESDYHQLTQSLRCPQCQNNNIADSNATIAVDMRGKVFELLQEGKSLRQFCNLRSPYDSEYISAMDCAIIACVVRCGIFIKT